MRRSKQRLPLTVLAHRRAARDAGLAPATRIVKSAKRYRRQPKHKGQEE